MLNSCEQELRQKERDPSCLPTSVKPVLSRETLDPRETGGIVPNSFLSLASRNKGLRPLPVLLLVEDSLWKKNE